MKRSVRMAVVAPSWGDPWREEDVIAKRVAAALACDADVEALVADDGEVKEDLDGAIAVRRFPTTRIAGSRSGSPVRAEFGREQPSDFGCRTCADRVAADLAREVPLEVQQALLRGDGSDAPELYDHLRRTGYDVVVFAGLTAASTVFGIEAVPAGTRTAILALARRSARLSLSIYDATLARAERVLAITTGERERLERRGTDRTKLFEIGFAIRVHELARTSDPVVPSREGLLAVVRDWTRAASLQWRLRRLAMDLRRTQPDVRICLLGRGAERFALDGWTVARHALSTVDVWRWTSRAIALFEPGPDRLLAGSALEAMMYGTPVLAHLESGAAREHAERGNGGLWYRTAGELDVAITWLRDAAARKTLGDQAKRYAEERWSDVDAFVARVVASVLGDRPGPLEAAPGIG